jgi:hypothetical protein
MVVGQASMQVIGGQERVPGTPGVVLLPPLSHEACGNSNVWVPLASPIATMPGIAANSTMSQSRLLEQSMSTARRRYKYLDGGLRVSLLHQLPAVAVCCRLITTSTKLAHAVKLLILITLLGILGL